MQLFFRVFRSRQRVTFDFLMFPDAAKNRRALFQRRKFSVFAKTTPEHIRWILYFLVLRRGTDGTIPGMLIICLLKQKTITKYHI